MHGTHAPVATAGPRPTSHTAGDGSPPRVDRVLRRALNAPVQVDHPDAMAPLVVARCALVLRRGLRRWTLVGSAAGTDPTLTAIRARAELLERCAVVVTDAGSPTVPRRRFPSSVGVAAHRDTQAAAEGAANELCERIVAVASWNGDPLLAPRRLDEEAVPDHLRTALGRAGCDVGLYAVTDDGGRTTVTALVTGPDRRGSAGLGRAVAPSAAAGHAVAEALMLRLGLISVHRSDRSYQRQLVGRLRAVARAPGTVRRHLESRSAPTATDAERALTTTGSDGISRLPITTRSLAAVDGWVVARAEADLASTRWSDVPDRAWRRGPYA